MAEQGAGFLQNVAKDVEEQDVERREGCTTESERCLQEPEKSVVTMAATASGVEKTGESSRGGDGELKKDINTVARRIGFSSDERHRIALLSRRITPTCDVAEVCRMAALAARKAAQSCRITAEATLNPATVAKNRVEALARRAVSTLNYPDSRYYRTLAAKYNSALRSASQRISNVKVASRVADKAAADAEKAAEALSVVRDEETLEEGARIVAAHCATSFANVAIFIAYKMEFKGLCALKKCWKHIDDAENMRTRLEHWRRQLRVCGENCGASENKLLTGAHIISLLLGCALLVSLQFFKFSTESFYSILSIGTIMVVWSVMHILYKLCVCYRKYRLQVKGNETKVIIGVIEDRLQELSLYFENNNRDLPSSESDEE